MFAGGSHKSRDCHGLPMAHPLQRTRAMRRLVFAMLIALPACGGDHYDDCSGHSVDKKLTINLPTDPSLQLKVESCRVDVDACPSLCAMAMQRTAINYIPDACTVGFTGDEVSMKVTYTAFTNECQF